MDDILREISKLSLRTAWKVADMFGPHKSIVYALAIENHTRQFGEMSSIEELVSIEGLHPEAAALLIEWAEVVVQERILRKRIEKVERREVRGQMRIRYIPTSTLVWYQRADTMTFRFKHDREIRGTGLMSAIEHYTTGRWPELPPAIPLQAYGLEMPDDPDEDPIQKKIHIPDEVLHALNQQGLLMSQEKWLWFRDGIMFKEWLTRAFPNAVQATAYNHSLNAPTLPGGILMEQKIRLTTIKTLFGVPAQTDGSGRYHPSHPMVDSLGRAGGRPVTVQFRLLNQDGLFAKGILVPDERCVNGDGEPEIWIDWKQIKGRHQPVRDGTEEQQISYDKMTHDGDAVTTAHIGIIACWDKPSKIDWCFEILENISTTPKTKQIISELVDDAYAKLQKNGIDGLAAKVAKDSPTAALAVKFITALNAMGHNISALGIPWLHRLIDERLQRIRWHIKQGAGQSGQTYVVCIDAALPPGKVVLSGFKPGTTLACFRIPVVLPQVLTTVEATHALPHHRIDGKIVPHTIFMNPHDITARMMGDDDGDIVGVSSDPRVLELWQNLIDNDIFAIEPKGTKINIPTGSPEGNEYMAHDQKGPVGRLTMMRARLLACGDFKGALAISVLIQEAIDKGKRKVKWSNWRMAVDPAYWIMEDDGYYHFREPGTDHAPGIDAEDLPLDEVWAWMEERMGTKGGVMQGQNPLGWRIVGDGRRVKRGKWVECVHTAKGYTGGNLVHHASDHGLKRWREVEDKFTVGFEELPMEQLIFTLLRTSTPEVFGTIASQPMEWNEYAGTIRRELGIQTLAGKFRTAIVVKDEKKRYGMFDTAQDELHSKLRTAIQQTPITTLTKIAQAWYMEVTNARQINKQGRGNINYAYHIVAWEGSPILKLLGIDTAKETCQFLNPKLEDALVQHCLKSAEPFEALSQKILNSTHHFKKTEVHGGDCNDCQDRLMRSLVREIRNDRTRAEHDWFGHLVTTMNGQEDEWSDPVDHRAQKWIGPDWDDYYDTDEGFGE